MHAIPVPPAEILAFLKAHPPFDLLAESDLEKVAQHAHLRAVPASDFVFEEGDGAQPELYVLWEGHIDIIQQQDDIAQLIDTLHPGDILGIRALLTENPYLASAKATEESVLIRIPAAIFMPFLEQYPQVTLFFARGMAAGMPIIHAHDAPQQQTAHFLSREPVLFMRTEDVLIPNPIEDLLKGAGNTPLGEVARRMQERRFGSFVVVDENDHPIGIATESDFIRRAPVQSLTWQSPVAELMSQPVVTIQKGATAAELILAMGKNKVDHLVITQDGTADSPVFGIISQRDILLMHGNNPAVLIRRMMEAQDISEMTRIRNRADILIHNYLHQEVSVPFVAAVATEINDTLLERAFALSLAQLEREGVASPGLSFCWLSLGSEGREEQLRRTDQDNALVYEDPSSKDAAQAHTYFLRLGTMVVEYLHAAGFELCPANIMASNAELVKPLSGWKQQFTDWITLPNPEALINASIFFDFRPGYGDKSLTAALFRHIQATIKERQGFLNYFAQSALQHPAPLGFFGRFILEKAEGQKDAFDIKGRALRPLSHAARVLIYAEGIAGVTNTIKRYEALAGQLADSKLFEEAALAYEILLRFRAINGFKNENSGRYIFPKQLTRIERDTLKTCFHTVDRMQKYIRNMFGVRG